MDRDDFDVLNNAASPEQRDFILQYGNALFESAIRRQGVQAYNSSRRLAATHIAAQAVGYAATVSLPTIPPPYRLEIWKGPLPDGLDGLGLQSWGGFVSGPPHYEFIEYTPQKQPDVAFAMIVRQLSGAVAEQLFLPGLKSGAAYSIDGYVTAALILSILAKVLGVDDKTLFDRSFKEIGVILRSNQTTLETLITKLERDRKIGPHDLRAMLAKVPHYEPPLWIQAMRRPVD